MIFRTYPTRQTRRQILLPLLRPVVGTQVEVGGELRRKLCGITTFERPTRQKDCIRRPSVLNLPGFMETVILPETLRKFEIPGHVTIASGNGGLPKINVATGRSTAEIYLHGAHITGFQKKGEPPLLFLSAKSHFAPGQPIRGGVPICFPWFGPREGGPAHGLARILAWELAGTAAAQDGSVTVRLRLPQNSVKPEWLALQTEFIVTIADQLTMELVTTNESADQILEIENCLHTYFHVGDIAQVSLAGLKGLPFDDFAVGRRRCA